MTPSTALVAASSGPATDVLTALMLVVFVALSLVPALIARRWRSHRSEVSKRGFEPAVAAFASHIGFTHDPGTLTARRTHGDLDLRLVAHAGWMERSEGPKHGYVPEGWQGVLFHATRTTRRAAPAVSSLELLAVGRTPWRWPVGAAISLVPHRPSQSSFADFGPTPLHPRSPRHDALREAYAWFPVTPGGVADPVRVYAGMPSLMKSLGRLTPTNYGRLPALEVEPALADALVRTAVLVQVSASGISVSRGVEGIDSAAYQDLLAVTLLVRSHVQRWSAALEASQRAAWRG